MDANCFAWRASETPNPADLLSTALPEVPRPQRRNTWARAKWLLSLLLFFALPFIPSAANIVWTNTADGNWDATTNWSPHQVPGISDNAFITNNGTYIVTPDAVATVASFTLGGTSGTQTFANSGQTFTLNSASTVKPNGVFDMSGGTLAGAGNLAVNGTFNWTGGTMSGSGVTFANGGLTMDSSGVITPTTLNLTGGTLGGSNTVAASGRLTWTAGTMQDGGVTFASAGKARKARNRRRKSWRTTWQRFGNGKRDRRARCLGNAGRRAAGPKSLDLPCFRGFPSLANVITLSFFGRPAPTFGSVFGREHSLYRERCDL